MSNYWAERIAKSQDAISRKSVKQIEKQLKKYYGDTMKRTIEDFENVYNKILARQEEGKEITPADLYKLDSYWKMQGQLKQELQKLGDKQISALSKRFEENFFEVYYSIAIPSQEAFSTISTEAARQMINSVWVADGKSFSQRIWGNTEKLAETLNEQLINCVVTGKKTTELKNVLQERFNVSYNNADMIARTEIAHIQTQAAQQRYKDYGIQMVEVFVDEDERTCPICAKHEGEKHPVNGPMPVPFHPRCRCCMIPVIDDNESEENNMKEKDTWELNDKQKQQLERVYKEYPEVKAKREEIEERNLQRKQRYEDRVKEIDDILSGKKNIETFSLRQNLLVRDRQGRWSVTPNWRSRIKSIQERDIKELEFMEMEDFFVLSNFVFCADCGKPIPVNGKATNAIKRCPECQEIYRKKYKAQKEKERRAKKKLNK